MSLLWYKDPCGVMGAVAAAASAAPSSFSSSTSLAGLWYKQLLGFKLGPATSSAGSRFSEVPAGASSRKR